MDLTEADEGIRDWANQHASEFVPMFGWRSAQPPSWLGAVNREGDCVMLTAHTPFEHRHSAPACSMEQIAGTLKQTAANLTVKPRYLMAFNEPYDASHAWKNISAAEAVEMWRYRLPAKHGFVASMALSRAWHVCARTLLLLFCTRRSTCHSHHSCACATLRGRVPLLASPHRLYLQPAAKLAGLKLISPTTGAGSDLKGKQEWIAEFLRLCWQRREGAGGCRIESVVAFAIHEYQCSEEYWSEEYGAHGTWRAVLKAKLRGGSATGTEQPDWDAYVDARPFWVTETNCNWDERTHPPTSAEQCRRVAGQKTMYGAGSLAAFEALETVERYSWWPLYHEEESGKVRSAHTHGRTHEPARTSCRPTL